MSLKKLKNRLKAEGIKFDVLCAMPEGTTLRVGKDLDGVLMGTSKNRRFQPATVSSGLKSSGLPVL